jgi:ribosome-associated protein
MRPRAQSPSGTDRDTPSKSQRKRDMLALQALGESLLPLADERLQRMPISPELIDAVRSAREIRAHEGRRRQLQYIGRLMRAVDADALRAALDAETREHRVATAVMHAAERWRERIVADDQGLREWLERHPGTRAELDALVPRARRELAAGGPGRAYRELFRTLRDRLA